VDGDAPATNNVGIDNVVTPYDNPRLSKIRLKFYSAAAGSAAQTTAVEVVVRGVKVVPILLNPLFDDEFSLHTATQTDRSYGFSNVTLDRIEYYVRRAPLPWQVRTLLPGLFNVMPSHDQAMLAISLTSVIRGIRISAKVILG